MTALIIETSGRIPWIALSRKQEIKEICTFLNSHSLTPCIYSGIKKFLENRIDYIAIGIGPGSYVGTRTGAIIAKTLSFALKKSLVSFPSPIGWLPECTGPFTYVSDAKMGQCAVFIGKVQASTVTLSPFTLVSKDDLSSYLAGMPPVIQGDAPNSKFVASYVYEKYLRGEVCLSDELKLVYYR